MGYRGHGTTTVNMVGKGIISKVEGPFNLVEAFRLLPTFGVHLSDLCSLNLFNFLLFDSLVEIVMGPGVDSQSSRSVETGFRHEKEAEKQKEKSKTAGHIETSSETCVLYDRSRNWTRKIYSPQDAKIEKRHHNPSSVYEVVVRYRRRNEGFECSDPKPLDDSTSR